MRGIDSWKTVMPIIHKGSMPDIKEKYEKKVMPAMQKKFGYKNVMMVPLVEKAVINVGMGSALKEKGIYEKIEQDIALIGGQKAAKRSARKAIAGFKTRKGMPVGISATLRGKRMYDFIDRLMNIALPRTRDFRGLKLSSVDEHGNLNIGIKEQIVFPEVAYESLKDIFSFQITVTTTARNHDEGVALLRLMGFPLKEEETGK